MKEPKIVSDKVTNPINYHVIFAILSFGIITFVTFQFMSDYDIGVIVFIFSVAFSLTVAVFSFKMSRKYRVGKLAKAYLFLGLGFVSYVVAELLYYTFDLILGIQAYPSVADIFFFALYPLVLCHLLIILKSFHVKINNLKKVWIITIPVFSLIVYVMMYVTVPDAELNFDFYYGLIFVAGASTTLSFAILVSLSFREGALSVVWLLLVVGLMINNVGDIWYYNLETFGEYYDAHPVTIMWFVANLFITYSLYKNTKII